MKKALAILFLVFYSCAPIKVTVEDLASSEYELDNKVKSLILGLSSNDNIIRFESQKLTNVQSNITTIVERELENNISEDSRIKYGYLDYTVTWFEWNTPNQNIRTINGLLTLSTLGLWFPTYFIEPEYEGIMEVEINIYDSQKIKIKKYIMNIHKPYSGKLPTPFIKYIAIDLTKSAIKDFKDQVANDIDYINSELEKSGAVNTVN